MIWRVAERQVRHRGLHRNAAFDFCSHACLLLYQLHSLCLNTLGWPKLHKAAFRYIHMLDVVATFHLLSGVCSVP